MLIKEVHGDLFTASGYYFAHCVSDDFALGAGIAVQFNKRFNMREKLNERGEHGVGRAILVDNVFNLITKSKYFGKPTYSSLGDALIDMRDQCVNHGVKKIAMPRIGCGLDKLNWPVVKTIIVDVFQNTDIEIAVYEL